MSCCARETPNAAQKILRSPRLFFSSPDKDDKGLCKSLPELNQQLLKHMLLILRRVCKNAPFTHTTPILAGHFVGPSLLWRPSSQFVAYPSENVHRTLAKLVKCLILFLDDIWNDLNEEEIFPTLKPQAPRDDSGTQKPSDAFVGRSVPAYVDEMEQESRRNNRIRDVLQTSQEYASFELLPASSSSGNKVQASCPPSNPSGLQPRLNSRSVHTWPGCGKAKVGQAELDKSQFNDTLSRLVPAPLTAPRRPLSRAAHLALC
ncbi:uncharacterized protein ISCGN_028048 [Ixodes scapularis]